jgi:FkbM family methyltransferase
MLNFVKRTLRSSLDALGFEIRRQKQLEQADDPYHALSLLLDPKEVTTIIDAGASIGDISKKLANLFPLATVHAIEPYPPFHECLDRIVRKNKRIRVSKLALSDQNGTAFLQINKSEGTNSLLPPAPEDNTAYGDQLDPNGEVRVETQTLDAFMKRNLIEQVHFLKLDLQGSELRCLRGASKAMETGSIRCILSEIMFARSYKDQPTAGALFHELIEKRGFTLFNLYQPHYHNGRLLQAEGLFLLPSVLSENKVRVKKSFQPHSLFPMK